MRESQGNPCELRELMMMMMVIKQCFKLFNCVQTNKQLINIVGNISLCAKKKNELTQI